ncbi:expressed unknown protein [Seminavis robusta]|uniref:Uncharacterized protein n=1 Tax=Seminavis robusta TaxID=568900 RepID=A0A9N8F067_9STRA|nr:expressed unknown protein [Seminavis robusta]|eukprot:Sro2323_g323300.1 n/a (224) ;mRNA; r:8431-9102
MDNTNTQCDYHSKANMIAWVSSELKAKGFNSNLVQNVETMLNRIDGENINASLLAQGVKDEFGWEDDLMNAALSTKHLQDHFKRLVQMMRLRRNARLPRPLLLESDLEDYVAAAEQGETKAAPFLDYLMELQEQGGSHGDVNVNSFASIIASSGTGKTQLAATAALTYKKATTIYLNFGAYGGSDAGSLQRFYRPHGTKEFDTFMEGLSEFAKTGDAKSATFI